MLSPALCLPESPVVFRDLDCFLTGGGADRVKTGAWESTEGALDGRLEENWLVVAVAGLFLRIMARGM